MGGGDNNFADPLGINEKAAEILDANKYLPEKYTQTKLFKVTSMENYLPESGKKTVMGRMMGATGGAGNVKEQQYAEAAAAPADTFSDQTSAIMDADKSRRRLLRRAMFLSQDTATARAAAVGL